MQSLSRPLEPTFDNYARFECRLKLPKTLDLGDSSAIKVIWSKEKESAEQEQRRREEIARKLREQKQHLTKLVKFGQSCATKVEGKKWDNQAAEKVQAACK